MAGFLYYRAESDSPLSDADREALAYALDGPCEERQCSVGPDGGRGLVFSVARRQGPEAIGYHPSRQTWRAMPRPAGEPAYWVGFWNDAKPTPADLKRPKLLRGPEILLTDGQPWQVPIVRRFDAAAQKWQSCLPAYLDYDKTGAVVPGEPLAQYAHLWDVVTPIADAQLDEENAADSQAVCMAVVALLQANYVVGLAELVLLKALADDDSLAMVALTSCRYDQLHRWLESLQKKSDPRLIASGETSPGGGVG